MRATIVMRKTTVRTECRPSRAATGGARAGRRGRTGCLVALAVTVLASPVLFARNGSGAPLHRRGAVVGVESGLPGLARRCPGDGLAHRARIRRVGVRLRCAGCGQRSERQPGRTHRVAGIGAAVYSGTLPLGPGQWRIVATAHQGNSSLPAIESTHRETLEIDETGQLLAASGGGSAATTVLAIVLPVCAVVVILAVVLRRRRLGLDDGTDAEGDPDEGVSEAPAASGDPVRD